MAIVNSQEDLHKLYDGVPCPRCPNELRSRVKTTIFGKGAFIRVCDNCGWSVGVDDSANLCDLGTERWVFEVVDGAKGNSCLKDMNHAPRFIGLDAESLMRSICVNCLKTGIMFSADGKAEYASDKLPPVCDVEEILYMIFANATQNKTSPELDSLISDSIEEEIAMIVDTESDELIARLLSTEGAEQTESLFACKCGRKDCPKCRSDLHSGTSKTLKDTNAESTFSSLGKTPVKAHVRVTNLNQLQPGDHIAWDRCYPVWHHAIVVCVETGSNEIIVIHNSAGLKDNPNGKIASVRLDTVEVSCRSDFLYLYQYSDDECYPPEEVIERAMQCLDQSYNPFTYNCEHFARWCKTGLKYCLQLKNLRERLKMGSSNSFVKVIEVLVMVALRLLGNSETMGGILATGAESARSAIKSTFESLAGSTTLLDKLALGTMIGSIFLSVATEVIFFIYKVYKAKMEVNKNEMPWDEFQRNIVQLIFESLFGLGGSIATGLAFSLIPCAGPFVSPLGYLLGNWIGRLLGAVVGRLVGRQLPIVTLPAS